MSEAQGAHAPMQLPALLLSQQTSMMMMMMMYISPFLQLRVIIAFALASCPIQMSMFFLKVSGQD
jgi:hypothetical protein